MKSGDGLSSICSKVIAVLEHPSYKWRTLSAIARELDISEHDALEALQQCGVEIVRSNSSDGEFLFTTRRHLREKSTIAERLSRALRNRGA